LFLFGFLEDITIDLKTITFSIYVELRMRFILIFVFTYNIRLLELLDEIFESGKMLLHVIPMLVLDRLSTLHLLALGSHNVSN
jgi:hypothetical protein